MPATRNETNAPFFVDNEVIRLTSNGIWLADGIEITHEGTRLLFSKNLFKDMHGYFIQVGKETKRIEVEDTAHFVTRLEGDLLNPEIVLMSGVREPLRPETLMYRTGRLTCRIQNGNEEAKFLRVPYFELLKNLQENETGYFLRMGSPTQNFFLEKKGPKAN